MKTGQKANSVSKEAKATTETTINNEAVTSNDEYLPLPPQDADPAYITVTAGMTKNLGNFNSCKVSISIHYPCDPSGVDGMYPKLKSWVDKRISAEMSEIQSYIDTKKASV